MTIARYLILDSSNFKPIISSAVVHGDIVYLCGVTADPIGDITVQTRQVLQRIDDLLARAGTEKSKLLTARSGSPTCGTFVSTMLPGTNGSIRKIRRSAPACRQSCLRPAFWSRLW